MPGRPAGPAVPGASRQRGRAVPRSRVLLQVRRSWGRGCLPEAGRCPAAGGRPPAGGQPQSGVPARLPAPPAARALVLPLEADAGGGWLALRSRSQRPAGARGQVQGVTGRREPGPHKRPGPVDSSRRPAVGLRVPGEGGQVLESAVGGGGDRVSVRICVRKPEELSSLPPGPPHLVLLAPELLGGGWPGWGGPAGR